MAVTGPSLGGSAGAGVGDEAVGRALAFFWSSTSLCCSCCFTARYRRLCCAEPMAGVSAIRRSVSERCVSMADVASSVCGSGVPARCKGRKGQRCQ